MRYIQTYLKAVQSFEAYVKLLISKVLFITVQTGHLSPIFAIHAKQMPPLSPM